MYSVNQVGVMGRKLCIASGIVECQIYRIPEEWSSSSCAPTYLFLIQRSLRKVADIVVTYLHPVELDCYNNIDHSKSPLYKNQTPNPVDGSRRKSVHFVKLKEGRVMFSL